MIEYINPGGDYLGLEKLDKIDCPDCHREYLQRSKLSQSKLLCINCGLTIDEREIFPQSKYVPEVGQDSKPFDNQTAANKGPIPPGPNEGRAFIVSNTIEQDLESVSLKGMAQPKDGVEISGRREINDEGLDKVREMTKKLGDGVKVHLE